MLWQRSTWCPLTRSADNRTVTFWPAIPETQAAALMEFAKVGGKAGAEIGAAVKFRESVMKEFDKLVLAAGLEMPLESDIDLTIH
jgi:hypothetical protein